MKRTLHLFLVVVLVFTTTGSIWQHLLDQVDDPIELSSEQETDQEKSEKENKTESGGDDHLTSEGYTFAPEVALEQQNKISSYLTPVSKDSDRLYILLHRLKVDC